MKKQTYSKLRKLIREEIEKELSTTEGDFDTVTFSLPITLKVFYTKDDFESEEEWNEWINTYVKQGNIDLGHIFGDEAEEIDNYLREKTPSDIKITYGDVDDDLNEGDYEISSKLSTSEIEKKKKEIKTKDPKATIAVKESMLREEDDVDSIDDEDVDKQAQKGAKTVNRKASKLDRVTRDLVQLQNIMKEMAKKYQEAEGDEKEKIVADLKQKTKAKKELEDLKAQLESGVVGKGGEVGLEM